METEAEVGLEIQTHLEGEGMAKVEETIEAGPEEDPDMSHPDPQEEIPDQEVTIDQDQALTQDQGLIGQDPIATTNQVLEIRNQNQIAYILVPSMERKLKIIQQTDVHS